MIPHRLQRIAAAVLPSLVTLIAAELILRGFPGLVPIDVGTALYSVYGTEPGGIYFLDRPTRANFMWPHYHTRAYWNGYVWEHRTDELGFRNPDGLRDRTLVWLGDSLIYGHGVEEEDTAVHRLRSEHGWGAYNAARQGDCLYQEYLVARLLLPRLRPRTLVLTVFSNDFADLEIYRTAEEIAAASELSLDVDALAARLAHPAARRGPLAQLHRVKLWRLAALVLDRIAGKHIAAPPAAGAPPAFIAALADDARWTPIARYYERVIADLAERSRAAGTELVLLNLDLGDRPDAGPRAPRDRLRALLESIGREHALRALDTRGLFESCAECFLPRDGHLSPEGHRRLAGFIAEALRAPEVA